MFWFFHIYFAKFVKYPSAEMHREWCRLMEDEKIKFLEIIGFRGSAKTTYAMLALPIWAIITGRKHYVMILGDTWNQIKEHIANIRYELEENKLLINDFGPFEGKDLWTATDIVIPKYNAKISARSTGQKVRGARYKQWRPDLIIADDVENLESVRTKEQRDKTYKWFTGDVLNAGDIPTRFILIGNLLHKDCLTARIKKEIEEGKRDGVVKEYPLIDSRGRITWRGKYPDKKAIEKKKREVVDLRTWQREYLLKIVPEEGQVVEDEWIRYWDTLPKMRAIAIGTDLAISKKEVADYTAICVIGLGKDKNFYNLKSIQGKWNFFEAMEKISEIYFSYKKENKTIPVVLGIEDVAYQRAAIEYLKKEYGIPARAVERVKDKRARLEVKAPFIKDGMVYFSKDDEDLIIQLTGFGIEAHDDLVDAWEMAMSLLENLRLEKKIVFI